MAAIVASFQRLQKIESACAPKDDPAPVYLLDEILELARASPEEAQAAADALERKLASRSPVVKFKALRVIKHLCTKGCSTFQRCMQRHSGAVRELVHFRGDPDPFKGDVPNARVREFAKEVLEALFNASPVATASAAQGGSLAAQGRIQGFGSGGPGAEGPQRSGYGGGGGGFNGGGGGGGGGFSGGGGLAATLGDGPLAAGVATVASAINDFLGNPSTRTGLTGSRYGGSGSPRRNGGYGGFEPMGGYAGGASASAAPRVTAAQVLGSEEGLVDDVCTPGGLRPAPDASDLRRFVEAASAMDGLRLAELLRAKMEAPAGPGNGWQVALRALCALEAVLQRGSSQACGEVAVMFQSEPTAVQVLATSTQPTVRDAAARCLRLLLGDDAVPQAAHEQAAAPTGKKGAAQPHAAAPVHDLLALDEGPAPAAAAAAAAAAPSSGAAAIDLLGDLAGEPAPAAAAGDSLFAGLEVGGAGGAAAVDDLFGGLSLAPAAAAAVPVPAPRPPVPPPAAAPRPAAGGPLDDLLFAAVAPTAAAAQPPAPGQQQQPWGQVAPGQQPLQQPPQPQQQPQQAAVQMQAFGGLGAPAVPAAVKVAPHGSMGAAHGRVLAAGGAGGSFSPNSAATAAAQQPWSAGISRDHAAFDFVLDEFGK